MIYQSTITQWRQVLESLMTDFQAGDSRIDPKNGLKTCNNSYCKLQSLCRVGELEQQRKTSLEEPPQEPSS